MSLENLPLVFLVNETEKMMESIVYDVTHSDETYIPDAKLNKPVSIAERGRIQFIFATVYIRELNRRGHQTPWDHLLPENLDRSGPVV